MTMKTSCLIAGLSALIGVQAGSVSTVIAPDCKPAPSTPDIVTRSPVPTTPCNAPPLTTVRRMTTSTKTSTTVYTVTKCPATVANCPIGKPTTEVRVYTTVCPVATPGGEMQNPEDGNMPAPPKPSSPPVVQVAGARRNMVVGSACGVLALAAVVILV